MTTDELRAEIEATKTRVQEALARRRELEAATEQALERQRLRRELEQLRLVLDTELMVNVDEEQFRRGVDEDIDFPQGLSVGVPVTVAPHECKCVHSVRRLRVSAARLPKASTHGSLLKCLGSDLPLDAYRGALFCLSGFRWARASVGFSSILTEALSNMKVKGYRIGVVPLP